MNSSAAVALLFRSPLLPGLSVNLTFHTKGSLQRLSSTMSSYVLLLWIKLALRSQTLLCSCSQMRRRRTRGRVSGRQVGQLKGWEVVCSAEMLCSGPSLLHPPSPHSQWVDHMGHHWGLGDFREICRILEGKCGMCLSICLWFHCWSGQYQIPLTNPYPRPRSVLILDNCSIHHADEVRALVEDEARMYSFILSAAQHWFHYRMQVDIPAPILTRQSSKHSPS